MINFINIAMLTFISLTGSANASVINCVEAKNGHSVAIHVDSEKEVVSFQIQKNGKPTFKFQTKSYGTLSYGNYHGLKTKQSPKHLAIFAYSHFEGRIAKDFKTKILFKKTANSKYPFYLLSLGYLSSIGQTQMEYKFIDQLKGAYCSVAKS